jgi:hypothetical protein
VSNFQEGWRSVNLKTPITEYDLKFFNYNFTAFNNGASDVVVMSRSFEDINDP